MCTGGVEGDGLAGLGVLVFQAGTITGTLLGRWKRSREGVWDLGFGELGS